MEKVKVENGGYLAVAVMADFGEVQEDLTKNVIFDKDLEKMREWTKWLYGRALRHK